MRFGTLTAALVAGCLTGLAASAAAVGDGDGTPRLTVTGEGSVTAAPDMAIVQLGIVAEDPQAVVAMQEMSRSAAAVLARLEAEGIAARDVQTSGLSLEPRWSDRSRELGTPPPIETFVAASQVSVRVRDLDRLGGILDAVVQDGANVFRGLQFGLQEPGEVQDEARRAAVAEAARKAALYAEAAGVELGAILSLDEMGAVQPRMMRAQMEGLAAAAVPVAAGELEISASVTITYALGGGTE